MNEHRVAPGRRPAASVDLTCNCLVCCHPGAQSGAPDDAVQYLEDRALLQSLRTPRGLLWAGLTALLLCSSLPVAVLGTLFVSSWFALYLYLSVALAVAVGLIGKKVEVRGWKRRKRRELMRAEFGESQYEHRLKGGPDQPHAEGRRNTRSETGSSDTDC